MIVANVPITAIVTMAIMAVSIVLHVLRSPETFVAAFPRYAVQLVVPILMWWLAKGPHAEEVILGCDLIFTTALSSHALLPHTEIAATPLMLSLKMLATALLIGWTPRVQAISAITTIVVYWVMLTVGPHPAGPATAFHQVLAPAIAGMLSIAGALRTELAQLEAFNGRVALVSSEASLRTLIDTGPDGILVVDGPLVTFANPPLLRMLGYISADAVHGRHLLDLVAASGRAAVEQYVGAAGRGQIASTSLETQLSTIDGRLVDVAVRAAPTDARSRQSVQLVIRDITDRKRAETALQASEQRFRSIIENSLDLVSVLERDGRFRYVNPSFERTLGYDHTELVGQPAFRFVHEEDLPRVLEAFEANLRSDNGPASVPVRFRHRNGDWLVLEAIGKSMLDDPVVAGIVINARDITQRSRSESEKASLLAVTTALARVGQEIISAVDTTDVLERLCRLSAEVLDCDVSHTFLYHPEDDSWAPVAGYGDAPEDWTALQQLSIPTSLIEPVLAALDRDGVVQAGQQINSDLGVARLQAAYRVTTGMFVALRRGDQIVGVQSAGHRNRSLPFSATDEEIARGLAQLGSLALENARLIDELEQANRVKSDFVATMSHELRTPLNVIIGYNDLLLEGTWGELNRDQQDSLQRVGRSARELLELISATLDLSRLEQGRLTADSYPVDLTDLMAEIDADTRAAGLNPGVRLLWRLPSDLPPLHTDPTKLKVVLKNLVNNAVKFTHRGSITVGLRRLDEGIEFHVTDTGIGIAPDSLERIFEPFTQADSTVTSRFGGAGLGLHIVRRLLDLLGGTVSVESSVGHGTTFRVWLPSNHPAASKSRSA